MKNMVIAAIMAFIVPALAWSETNFVLPQGCAHGATGAPSSDLATDDDQPVVEIYYYPFGGLTRKFVDVYSITSKNKIWYVSFIAPAYTDYTIATIYSPFLVSYQSATYSNGFKSEIQLQNPGEGVIGKKYDQFTVALGNALSYAFVEFDPDYPGADPFTMQADENGRIVLNCYINFATGNNVTVYSKDHHFIGTGSVMDDGSITWDK